MNQEEHMNQGRYIMSQVEGSMSCFSETNSSSTIYMNPMMAATRSSGEDNGISLSLLLNLSTIQDKVHEIQSLVNFFMISPNNNNQSSESTSSLAAANVESLVQDIITAASSMMLTCQQLQSSTNSSRNYEIVELSVEDLLAKYTHYCQICGKGFKRDANLRMHMRAHGDEYKTREALISPTSRDKNVEYSSMRYYYSCPHQGCRWNQRHEKFQPLKSVICAKNHYKRSHCPKIYMCRRCNVKHFSVLSDLRTHEKHCGDIKWVCSCGTRFSRKDKLMSHVSLFSGHSPAHEPSQQQPPMITP
ncbi:hypothetical protein HID58_088457 [Brassica napus]|uniref:C2H2-type domain-containing protein n=1 Tax=Brassica napus TaxID=3708 RepID=A0ABQ7XWD8_BRANA|nr:hypothetical protein HID58_088457 [Brassica napus]